MVSGRTLLWLIDTVYDSFGFDSSLLQPAGIDTLYGISYSSVRETEIPTKKTAFESL